MFQFLFWDSAEAFRKNQHLRDQLTWLGAIYIQLQDDPVYVSNADSFSSMCSFQEPSEIIFMYSPPKAQFKAQ